MQGAGTNESLLWDVSRLWSEALRWASEAESILPLEVKSREWEAER